MPVKPLAPISVLWPSSIQVAEAPGPAPQPSAAKPSPQLVSARFKFLKPEAKQVHVCGEFNNWSPDATPLQLRPNGQWETTLQLRPGRYQYKFVVDGQWITDPNAAENVPNQHGSLNSLLVV
jgi:1,4-alpha-glucan branching enzyme